MPIVTVSQRCIAGCSDSIPRQPTIITTTIAYALWRALEVTLLTGTPFSTHRYRHRQQGPRYAYVAVGLTRCRAELYDRIGARAEAMLAAGWLAEVKALKRQGYDRSCHPMNSLGYRELLAYLDGQYSWPETAQAIVKATRQLAKAAAYLVP